MPYEVIRDGGKFCVTKKGGGRSFGCHDSRSDANEQMAALYVAEKSLGEAGFKDWDLEMAVYTRRVGQASVDYRPLGATDTEGCANCQWYVSPDQCMLVEGEVSPTGISNLWMAKSLPQVEPVPVVIVEASTEAAKSKSPLESLFDGIRGLIRVDSEPLLLTKEAVIVEMVDQDQDSGVSFYKDADADQLRFVMWVSNKWRDRDIPVPEIISEQAHLDYVAHVDRTKDYPSAWLWHTPGTEWGKVDFVDYADGFLIESGIVIPGMEDVAKSVEDDGNLLGVSHGYKVLARDAADWSIIKGYRQFEASPLPRGVAANLLTGTTIEDIIASMKEVVSMAGFNKDKRDFLVGKLGEARVGELEKATSGMKAIADQLGLDYKDLVGSIEDGTTTPTPPTPDPTPPSQQPQSVDIKSLDVKALADEIAKQLGMEQLSVAFKSMQGDIDTLKKGMDAAVSKAISPRIEDAQYAWQLRPSESKDNIISTGDPESVRNGKPAHEADLDAMLTPLFPAPPAI